MALPGWRAEVPNPLDLRPMRGRGRLLPGYPADGRRAIITPFDPDATMATQFLLSEQQLQHLAPQVQAYLADQLGLEIGSFDARFLLDFLADKMGRDIYNKALQDAQTALAARMETLQAAIWELER